VRDQSPEVEFSDSCVYCDNALTKKSLLSSLLWQRVHIIKRKGKRMHVHGRQFYIYFKIPPPSSVYAYLSFNWTNFYNKNAHGQFTEHHGKGWLPAQTAMRSWVARAAAAVAECNLLFQTQCTQRNTLYWKERRMAALIFHFEPLFNNIVKCLCSVNAFYVNILWRRTNQVKQMEI